MKINLKVKKPIYVGEVYNQKLHLSDEKFDWQNVRLYNSNGKLITIPTGTTLYVEYENSVNGSDDIVDAINSGRVTFQAYDAQLLGQIKMCMAVSDAFNVLIIFTDTGVKTLCETPITLEDFNTYFEIMRYHE